MLVNKIYHLFIISLILSSCSISNNVVSERRIRKKKYMKGFYNKKSNKNLSLTKSKNSTILSENIYQFSFKEVVKPALNDDNSIDITVSKNYIDISSLDDSPVILSKNTINQKLFLDNSTPKIDFKNKNIDEHLNQISNKTDEEIKVDPISLISLSSGLFSIISLLIASSFSLMTFNLGIAFVFASFIFGVLSLGFGIAGIVRGVSKSETHKGFGMAAAGICLGAIFGGISAIILMIWSLFQ